jgi:DNA-binding transcriptional regulator YbjK
VSVTVGSRQEQVLDAAIAVLGAQGMRHLTHRAVDAEAGLPQGSTSNYFRTREALVTAVLHRLAAVERIGWAQLAADLGETGELDVDRFVETVGRLVRQLAGSHRVATLARQAVFTEAAFHPELRRPIAAARAELEAWGADWIRRLGSPDPVGHFWALMALVDGLLAHQCAVPDPAFDPVPAIRTLVRGMQPGA